MFPAGWNGTIKPVNSSMYRTSCVSKPETGRLNNNKKKKIPGFASHELHVKIIQWAKASLFHFPPLKILIIIVAEKKWLLSINLK